MEVKTVKPQHVFFHSEITTLKEIQEVAKREIEQMYAEAGQLGLKETGPMQFVYYGCDDNPETKFTLEIAMVVDGKKQNNGKYKFKELEEFTCATTTHHGDINEIGNTYEAFIPKVIQEGKQLSDQMREVYHHWVSPESTENVTEIQLGIQ